MQRYFLNEPYHNQATYVVGGDHYHHIVRVMRMEPGQKSYLVFHDSIVIVAEITHITETEVWFKELEKEVAEKELPLVITIACGLPKGDKLDWIVQKGTELGAFAFIGFPAQTSVVKWDHKKREAKKKRLSKIATEAAEQSQRQQTPTVQLFAQSEELLASFSNYDQVLVAYEEAAKKGEHSKLAQVLAASQQGARLLLVFGPEGGFSKSEIDQFQAAGALLCGLGPRILRAETAPLYALSAVSYQTELLG
ncbi:16S rRNA (uracil(1498)-N(3))-methyltransferase [Enterococcus faecalis]